MRWFMDCSSLDEVKTIYKKLAKVHHPDLGGDTLTMQEINKEYAFASAKVIRGEGLSEEETEHQILSSEAYRRALEAIVHLDGITIEVVGWWIWVTGNTRPLRTELKAAGYFFASRKLAWYFRTADYKVSRGGKKSLDEIRAKYGSEVIGGKPARPWISR